MRTGIFVEESLQPPGVLVMPTTGLYPASNLYAPRLHLIVYILQDRQRMSPSCQRCIFTPYALILPEENCAILPQLSLGRVFRTLRGFYNRQCLHSTLGYLPPQQFEQAFWTN